MSDCGCIDVELSPNAGAFARPVAKFELKLSHWIIAALPATVTNTVSLEATSCSRRKAEGSPPFVRLLAPHARHTVLIV
jgi:hypothetical protein